MPPNSAYKQKQKIAQNQLQKAKLPDDLAEIVAVWLELPKHIEAAIKALVQTFNNNKSK